MISEYTKKFIEGIVEKTKQDNPKWGEVFKKGFMDTLESTITVNEDGTVYMLTGDIPAMWLRDSTAQMRPYLVLANEDEKIYDLVKGLIEQQFRYINIDPYANAFNQEANGRHGFPEDITPMTPWTWERKYEIDSLCYPIQLAYLFYKNTGATEHFNETFYEAIETVVDLWILEQNHENSDYSFVRLDDRPEDTLINDGKGSPVGYTGMTWCGFNPSDDRCIYHYLVPSNMFAAVVLTYLEELVENQIIEISEELFHKIVKLRDDIDNGIKEHAIIKNKAGNDIFAYEVDGLGNHILKDDPNVPSLLAAPYLGYCDNQDPVYVETRKTIFSPENPYYYEGEFAKGLGSSHTEENYIWPIALSMEGLTTDDLKRKKELLDTLVNTDGGTFNMHESFNVNNPNHFSREWFSWANMMFCELLLDYYGIRVQR